MELTGSTGRAPIFLPDFFGRGRVFPTATPAGPNWGAAGSPGLLSHPMMIAKTTGARCRVVVLIGAHPS
ncbi:MAG: hypothetical protein WKF75_19955, partial [Singulisphaera sp.]